ncbi:hypothetical protein ABPG72_005550 [Tetrahymena utriculariae]
MGQSESSNSQQQKEKIIKAGSESQVKEQQVKSEVQSTPTPQENNSFKTQNQIIEQLSNSRLQLKQQREQEIKKVSESKEKDAVSKILKIMEQNQEQLVEILDERVQLINQNLEDKLLVLENKMDEISDKLREFENAFEDEFKSQNFKEEIDLLRNEVKQMVAISEKYIKDETKIQEIQNLSVLNKSIQKENKPSKKELNPLYNKLSMMRERSKIQKHMSDSQILKDLDDNMGYLQDNPYQYQNDYTTMNISSLFNQNNGIYNEQYKFNSKIE